MGIGSKTFAKSMHIPTTLAITQVILMLCMHLAAMAVSKFFGRGQEKNWTTKKAIPKQMVVMRRMRQTMRKRRCGKRVV